MLGPVGNSSGPDRCVLRKLTGCLLIEAGPLRIMANVSVTAECTGFKQLRV